MNPRQGGSQANYTGTTLEKYIQSRLEDRKYTYIQPVRFDVARYLEQPIYSKRYSLGPGIYGTELFCDFIIYHPVKWPSSLIIESKWQQSGGSVDEKYPYLVLNIQEVYPHSTIVVLDGGGYKAGAEQWLRSQAGQGRLLRVMSMAEFAAWVNQGHL